MPWLFYKLKHLIIMMQYNLYYLIKNKRCFHRPSKQPDEKKPSEKNQTKKESDPKKEKKREKKNVRSKKKGAKKNWRKKPREKNRAKKKESDPKIKKKVRLYLFPVRQKKIAKKIKKIRLLLICYKKGKKKSDS